MKIDWKKKLGSRKFWSLIAGFVSSLLIVFSFDESQITQVVGVIGAFGSVATYILAEAYVDGKAVGKDENSAE